jgi:hypothetical protein
LRHPFESIYTRGETYRSLKGKMHPTAGNASSDEEVGVVSNLNILFMLVQNGTVVEDKLN